MSAETAGPSVRMQALLTKIITLFAKPEDMDDSTNDGFAVLNADTKECRVRFLGNVTECKADDPEDKVPGGIRALICAVIDDYSYLLFK